MMIAVDLFQEQAPQALCLQEWLFLSYPPHFVYQLPAPLPDTSIIIVTAMSVCIVLFMWQEESKPVVPVPNSQRNLNSSLSQLSSSQLRTIRVFLLRAFFFLPFLILKKSVALLSRGRWRISQILGPLYPMNLSTTCGGVGYLSNERGFSMDSSLQRISSWKRNDSSVVLWCGKPGASARVWLGKANAER